MRHPFKITAITVLLVMCFLWCPGTALANPLTQDPTAPTETEVFYDAYTVDTSWFDYLDPKTEYTISTEAQLRGLASLVNEEQFLWKPNRNESFEGVTFILTRDITLTEPWTPIGIDDQITFSGTFDGKGHSISGIDVNTSDPYSGFFGHLSGKVRHLTLEGKVNSSADFCGGVAGCIAKDASVRKCSCNVLVNGRNEVGGIAGETRGTIAGCISYGEVVGASMVGGIVGESRGGTIKNSGNRGLIVSNGAGSFNNGTGGVAGRPVSASTLSGCYNTGDIISSNEATGGVAGFTNSSGSSIINCYSIGCIRIEKPQVRTDAAVEPVSSVELDLSQAQSGKLPVYAGGIAGYVGSQTMRIENCYNAGQITGADYTGGIIGKCQNELYAAEPPGFHNNYYGKGSFDSAIAANRDGKPMRVRGAATEVYDSAFGHLAASLGEAYRDDKSGNYGSKGYPVLAWQDEYQSEDSLAVLKHINKKTQQWLHDAHLMLDSDNFQQGRMLLRFFNKDYFYNDTIKTIEMIKTDTTGETNDNAEQDL